MTPAEQIPGVFQGRSRVWVAGVPAEESKLLVYRRVNHKNVVGYGTVLFIGLMMTCYPILHKVNCV